MPQSWSSSRSPRQSRWKKQKKEKQSKLSASEMRLKKVGLDLSAVAETIAEIDAKPSSYLLPIKASLQTFAADLRGVTHKMHDDALNNSHEALWAQAVDLHEAEV